MAGATQYRAVSSSIVSYPGESQHVLPFVPYVKQRSSIRTTSNEGNTSDEGEKATQGDSFCSSSPYSSRGDSFRGVRPFSTSWSSESSSSNDSFTPKSTRSPVEENNQVQRRGKKRPLFTIDSILADKKQPQEEGFKLKRVSELSGERPAKVKRTELSPPSAPQHRTSPLVNQQTAYIQACLQTYYQQQFATPGFGRQPSLADFRDRFPTPPMTPGTGFQFHPGMLSSPAFATPHGHYPVHAQCKPPRHFFGHEFDSSLGRHPTSSATSPVNDDQSCEGKSKRNRTVFTSEQLQCLENEFTKQHYMVGTERYYLARRLNLNESQVKVWFQNRRIKWRKQKNQGSGAEAVQDAGESPVQGDKKATFELLREQAATSTYR